MGRCFLKFDISYKSVPLLGECFDIPGRCDGIAEGFANPAYAIIQAAIKVDVGIVGPQPEMLRSERSKQKEGRTWRCALFYLGAPHKSFVGMSKLRSGFLRFTKDEQAELIRRGILETEAGVWLEDTVLWQPRLPISGLIMRLNFIRNKEYWNCHRLSKSGKY